MLRNEKMESNVKLVHRIDGIDAEAAARLGKKLNDLIVVLTGDGLTTQGKLRQ